MSSRTKLSNFNFNLPKELIAQYPAQERDQSRLMVVHRDTGKIEHKVFKDVLNYFGDGDVIMFNNTKVFPARLFGQKEKTDAKIEVFLLRELNKEARLWDVLVDPARKIRVGNKLYFADDKGNDVLIAEVVDNTTSRGRTIRFMYDGSEEDFQNDLSLLGNTPLPKYIDREPEEIDRERYQTVSSLIAVFCGRSRSDTQSFGLMRSKLLSDVSYGLPAVVCVSVFATMRFFAVAIASYFTLKRTQTVAVRRCLFRARPPRFCPQASRGTASRHAARTRIIPADTRHRVNHRRPSPLRLR